MYGTRDFYHLIKSPVGNLKNKSEDQKNPLSIAIDSIERNFWEREKSIQTFNQFFQISNIVMIQVTMM